MEDLPRTRTVLVHEEKLVPFSQASYLAQVKRLRQLAQQALTKYPIKVSHLRFIHHGENATFQVTSTREENFLLRIHRSGYHSDGALGEELRWLQQLSESGLFVPTPMASKENRLFEIVSSPLLDGDRRSSLLRWTHGKRIDKSLRPPHLSEIGSTIGRFQLHQPRFPIRYRKYWDADGLVGRQPKLGPVTHVPGSTAKQRQVLEQARKIVHRALKSYAQKFPKRSGFIHADLHFGNVIQTPNGLAAIDFDDCGIGPYVYDLVVPWMSALNAVQDEALRSEMKAALFSGYEEVRTLDKEDRKLFEHLIAARRIAMLGWLVSRSDNPRLRSHLKAALKSSTAYLKTEYDL